MLFIVLFKYIFAEFPFFTPSPRYLDVILSNSIRGSNLCNYAIMRLCCKNTKEQLHLAFHDDIINGIIMSKNILLSSIFNFYILCIYFSNEYINEKLFTISNSYLKYLVKRKSIMYHS
jgi:hypothetical protein